MGRVKPLDLAVEDSLLILIKNLYYGTTCCSQRVPSIERIKAWTLLSGSRGVDLSLDLDSSLKFEDLLDQTNKKYSDLTQHNGLI